MKVSLDIGLVRNGLVISVDWEHGTGMDHTAPATSTPVTQVGHTTMLANVEMDVTSLLLSMCK